MKSPYPILILILIVMLTSSCKVRYGAYFQRTTNPTYPHEKHEQQTIAPAEKLLVSSEPNKFIPANITESLQRKKQDFSSTISGDSGQSKLVQEINLSINKIVPPHQSLDISKDPEAFISKHENLEKSDQRKIKREIKKLVKEEIKKYQDQPRAELLESSPLATEEGVLIIVLAVILPPLAVGLHEGALNNVFWLNFLLTLLFYVPGIIHALIVVTR